MLRRSLWLALAVTSSMTFNSLASTATLAGDSIEFLSGTTLDGEVGAIDKAKQQIVFTATIGGRSSTRVFAYSKIHAVTYRGTRYVLNAKPPPTDSGTEAGSTTNGPPQRTKRQVDALIEQAGRTPPDWFESTPLNYPDTLDLAWQLPPPKGWNNQKNVGQFLWDIINPNPGRWREGIRFMHHMLTLHNDDQELRFRIMNSLGRMYHELIQDYARAAFWFKQAGIDRGSRHAQSKSGAHLAECYWKLGSKQAAKDLLNRLPVTTATVKLWGDLGETKRSVMMCEQLAKSNGKLASLFYLMAGNALRQVEDFDAAIAYYEKALQTPDQRKTHNRAKANLAAIKVFEKLDIAQVPDGTYKASQLGYEAQVAIEVVMKGGRIESVRVTSHREKQFYSSIEDTPAKIVSRQSVKGVEATSGATITSQAIVNATAEALSKAMEARRN